MPTTDRLLVAIRKKCMDCCGNSTKEVRRCNIKDCPLWPYRAADVKPPRRDKRQVSIFDYMKGLKVEGL